MAEHPVEKHLAKMGEHHKRTRQRHHAEATRLAAEQALVDSQHADLLAGKVEPPSDTGSDHGSS